MTEKLREKYKSFINEDGGIFVKGTRKRLLGLSPGRPGWDESSADFRYDVRRYVKQALIDLELFIEVADENDVNNVLNIESLKPIVEVLFWHPIVDRDGPNLERAKIAQQFIQSGFDYLTMKPLEISTIYRDIVVKAIELSHLLVKTFVVEAK